MSTLRRTALTILALVFPGAAQLLGKRWTAAALLGAPEVVLLGLLSGSVGRTQLLDAALDPSLVNRVGWILVGLGTLAAISVTETAIHVWAPPDGVVARAAGVVGVVVLAAIPAAAGTGGLYAATTHADAVNQVFQGGAVRAVPTGGGSIDDADTPIPTAPAGATPPTVLGETVTPVTANPPAVAAEGRWNVLLLGGDAGKGRYSLRTDAMILVSIDRATGDAAMVSVPRNMARLPMPEGPLREKFPKGWTDLANALYPYVASHPQMGDGSEQAPERAITGAIAEALGVPIDNYVLVDMGGFIDVIDALGGVDLVLSKQVPAPGNPYEAKHPVRPWFGPGPVHLDGTDALAYSRSREGDSDYRRMERQRCLLAAASRQVSPADLLTHYDDLIAAMTRSVRSDLSPEQARDLIDLYAKVDTSAIRSLGLVPPLVNTGAPNYKQVHQLVNDALYPPAPVADAPVDTAAPESTEATPPGRPATTPAPATQVLDDSSTC